MQPEIFSLLDGRAGEEVLAHWSAPKAFFVKASGFKIFYYHPLDADGTKIWETLAADKDLRVIHLKRRNRLETELSQKLATVTGLWLQTVGKKSRPTPHVTFEPEELAEAFERTSNYETEFDGKFQGHPVYELYYEDMLTNGQAHFEKICDFLGVPRCEAHSNLVKQGREPASQAIENFAALKAHFHGTRWAKFFERQYLACFLYFCLSLAF